MLTLKKKRKEKEIFLHNKAFVTVPSERMRVNEKEKKRNTNNTIKTNDETPQKQSKFK